MKCCVEELEPIEAELFVERSKIWNHGWQNSDHHYALTQLTKHMRTFFEEDENKKLDFFEFKKHLVNFSDGLTASLIGQIVEYLATQYNEGQIA